MDKQDMPTQIVFTVINHQAWSATGQLDKKAIMLKLTDEQRIELAMKMREGESIFEAIMSFD